MLLRLEGMRLKNNVASMYLRSLEKHYMLISKNTIANSFF